jgi:uncharacterized protein (DUF1697 family)
MRTLISFLRGINMTGHNSLRMSDLRELYIKLGFTDAETYIQSGNVIFSSDEFVRDISLKIENAILERFSYKIPVMVRTVQEIKDLFSGNPYINEEKFDPSKMAVLFLHEKPVSSQLDKVKNINYPPDRFEIKDREIFIYCPNGFGRTKLYTNFFENKMGVVGTARNWKSITTILDLAEKR